jgi:hypothetical protein
MWLMTTSDSGWPVGPGSGSVHDISELIGFALASLPAMRRKDGIFCFERRAGEAAPIGRSLRYTLMVALGLARAQQNGYTVPIDPVELDELVWQEIDSPTLEPGDLGLLLWTDDRLARGRADELVERLERALAANGGLASLVGMELGWIVTGLAHQHAKTPDFRVRALLARAMDQLLEGNQAPSALFRHSGRGWRRRFPNFATQIYSVLALAVVARHGLDDRALPAARSGADRILELQRPDGAWPWLFDTERGAVVERYEIYSVHQDAMAPMALLELAALDDDPRYARAVAHGLRWVHGHNELRADMVDRENGLVLRSIRRRRGLDRAMLAATTAASRAGLGRDGRRARLTELNPTDRPYHFGWVLEAWCGREDALTA